MRNNWLSNMDSEGVSPDIFSLESFVFQNFGSHFFSQLSSSVDSSIYHSRSVYVPGTLALQEAFSHVSRFAGSFLVWFCSGTSSNIAHDVSRSLHGRQFGSSSASIQVKRLSSARDILAGFGFMFRSRWKSPAPVALRKISSFTMKLLLQEAKRLQSYPVFYLAAALIPPFQNLSSKVLASPAENSDVKMHGGMDQIPREVESQKYPRLSFHESNWTKHAVEPKTGIEFPMILDNALAGEKNSVFNSEVLVGTGSKTMTVVKIKSLKVYAFGFYVHPDSLCKKLGPKYASISADELNNCCDFYQDLLREDVNMTVRLVVNVRGMKINAVRDTFEKSLRARLVKTNPTTDFECLRTFGSYFAQEIPLPMGTIINFRRTADGQLITEIGGNRIGSVHSKDLCRAFFDMYIGDVPVCEQTKEEIGRNVANIMKGC
ncbi:hypothetical protein L6164_015641 [Bauhinia variegata]|uniref:Uncharacterized protein n=1 Tax=Bauhinia variegata TaxID=167791 RepID=A0ACB9NL62_BAUVA|nr:hypothetical protein L6164_015641 [Bauhinia variegata]